jgi:nucleotide-binding universal stress UspA family protein
MNVETSPPQVVVAYDFSRSGDVALERAVELACRAPHHVLHFLAAIDPHTGLAIPPDGKVDYRYAERIQHMLSERLTAIFAGRNVSDAVHFFVHARIGRPVPEILRLAEEVGADLIIVGSHSRTGIERVLLGSVSERVVRSAGCPVMVARSKRYPHVEFEEVFEVEPVPHAHRLEPHRYSYSNNMVQKRPSDWPIS